MLRPPPNLPGVLSLWGLVVAKQGIIVSLLLSSACLNLAGPHKVPSSPFRSSFVSSTSNTRHTSGLHTLQTR